MTQTRVRTQPDLSFATANTGNADRNSLTRQFHRARIRPVTPSLHRLRLPSVSLSRQLNNLVVKQLVNMHQAHRHQRADHLDLRVHFELPLFLSLHDLYFT